MSYRQRLQKLAIANADEVAGTPRIVEADPRTLALARIAALVAVSGQVSSYEELVDSAISAGATPDEIVDVLMGIVGTVGHPRVVEASPRLAQALGLDLDEMLMGDTSSSAPD